MNDTRSAAINRRQRSSRVLLVTQDHGGGRLINAVGLGRGAFIDTVRDNTTAYEKLLTAKYEGVIVDLAQEQEGFDLLRSLRNSTLNKNAIACAVLKPKDDSALAFHAGAHFVLKRPINSESARLLFSIFQ